MRTNNINNFIDEVCDEIKYNAIKKNISDEIRSHLDDEMQSYLEEGIDEKTAEEKTIFNMGDPKYIGQKLNKIHSPKLDLKLLITSIVVVFFGIIVSYSLSKTIYKYNFGSESWFIENIVYVVASVILGAIIYFYDYTKLKSKSVYIFAISTIIGIVLIFSSNMYININQCLDVKLSNIQTFIIDLLLPLYIISFSGFINKLNLKIKRDIINLLVISLISLVIIGICSNVVYLYILLLSYIAIFCAKKFNKASEYSKKYKKNAVLTLIGIVFVSFMIYFVFYYPVRNIYASTYMLDIRTDILENSKFIGENKLYDGNLSSEIKYSDWAYGLQDAERTEIFVYIIGKYGYLAGITVIACMIYLIIKITKNIKSIKESYGKYIMSGLVTMILIHTVLHILSNLTYIPANSAVLPLVSYSNFNMVFNIILLSVILSVYRRKDIISYN